MATNYNFEVQVLKIWHHFHCLERTQVKLSKDNLTVFKIDNKDYIYRTAKKDSKLPTKVDIQEATTYVYNRDKQNDALGKEIKKMLNAKQEEKTPKKGIVEFDCSANHPRTASQDLDKKSMQVAMRLRIIGDEVQINHEQELNSLVQDFIDAMPLSLSRLELEYESRMEDLRSIITSGWNMIAFIFTLTERLANRISDHSEMVLNAALESIKNHQRTFIESQGRLNNNLGIEEIESSVDSQPSI